MVAGGVGGGGGRSWVVGREVKEKRSKEKEGRKERKRKEKKKKERECDGRGINEGEGMCLPTWRGVGGVG